MTKHLSKIERLISELCPNGVEFKELGELGEFYGGLSGKSKDDFSNGNAKFVTYMNIYSNIAVNTDIDVFVKMGENENQNRIEYGDVLFTGSSETPDECGMSSVLTKKINEPLYLNSFCFGFRLNNKNLLLPEFSKYLFRDEQMRKQIARTASGVTRFNVSKKRFAKMTIPLPPLEIQEEIVNILNSFTDLEADLEAELDARKRQYEHYRSEFLLFGDDVKNIELGKICDFIGGHAFKSSELKREKLSDEYLQVVKIGNVDKAGALDISKAQYSMYSDSLKKFLIEKDDVLIAMTGATVGKTAYSQHNNLLLNQRVGLVRANQTQMLKGFVKYLLLSEQFYVYCQAQAGGAAQGNISPSQIKSYKIPLPSLLEQKRVVSILDKFDALVNDISIGLPAELSARRSQYEYYRGKLLTFNEYAK